MTDTNPDIQQAPERTLRIEDPFPSSPFLKKHDSLRAIFEELHWHYDFLKTSHSYSKTVFLPTLHIKALEILQSHLKQLLVS